MNQFEYHHMNPQFSLNRTQTNRTPNITNQLHATNIFNPVHESPREILERGGRIEQGFCDDAEVWRRERVREYGERFWFIKVRSSRLWLRTKIRFIRFLFVRL
ncbi:hypothetical protein Droror1_Dr00003222 [Drosera rotundifolia]